MCPFLDSICEINYWRERIHRPVPFPHLKGLISPLSKNLSIERDGARNRSYRSSRNRSVSSKMYHGPLTSRRRDDTRAIPSRSTISFFFCFRSRYRQPGRVTRLRRLWQDGLLREARYPRAPAPLETSLYDPRAQLRSPVGQR